MHDAISSPGEKYQFDPAILGKIFLLQTALHVIPISETLAEFLCRGLENIPGTAFSAVKIESHLKSSGDVSEEELEVEICDKCNNEFNGNNNDGIITPGLDSGNYYWICIQTISEKFGFLLFGKSDERMFEPYKPFLENLANTVALVLETRKQQNSLNLLNEKLFQSKKDLEAQVAERTKELVLKNEELDRFFNTSLELLCIADTEGYFHRLNPEWGRIFGYEVDELQGKRFLDYVHPDDLEPTLKVVKDLGDQKEVVDFVNRFKCKDGTYRWIEWRSTPAGNLIYAAAHDITDRLRAETAIKEAHRFNQQIINSAEEGIIVYDKELRFKVWNPYMEQLTGFAAEDVIGKNPLDLFPFLKDGGVMEMLRGALNGVVSNSVDFPFSLLNGGKTGWASDTSAPLRNANGEIIGVIGTVRDITERKLVEKELVSAKEKAEEGEKIKSEFLAQVSHEIRTPLNIILGLLSLVKEENKSLLGEKSLIDFKGIDNAAARITRTIDSILNMSQLHIGAYEGNKTLFDLNEEIIENIYFNYASLAAEKGLRLNILDNEIDSRVYGDQYSVYQIFLNLIDNAIKFTNRGEINLEMRRDESGNLVVRVSDTGIGISEEYLQRLFEPFSQEQRGYTREYDGNGLGLALVKNYCLYNRAEIGVVSIKGEGTAFTVTFPDFKLADNTHSS